MNELEIFISIVTLFVIGALFGWVIELFFRRFVSQKKWMNPGFLVGPYLPIYGFGVVALYGLSNIDLSIISLGDQSILGATLKILMIAVVMITLEFIAGLIFIKGLKIKLWDYSDRKGNIMGIICPSFSLIWLLVGALYYFFLNPHLVRAIHWLSSSDHQIYYFFVGVTLGMIIVDFAYSIHLATKIREAAAKNKIIINIEKMRESIKEKSAAFRLEKFGKKRKGTFFFPFIGSEKPLLEEIDEYAQKDNLKDKS